MIVQPPIQQKRGPEFDFWNVLVIVAFILWAINFIIHNKHH